jgi:hypothetical protein
MIRRLGPDALARGLLLFWALYFAVVALSNLADLARALGVLAPGWTWVSGNLAFIASAIRKVGVPPAAAPWLLAGVIAWQILAAGLFGQALGRWHAVSLTGDWAPLAPPFVVGLGLWAAFVLLDEALLLYETGAEATHLRLLLVGLVTLLALRALAQRAADPGLAPTAPGRERAVDPPPPWTDPVQAWRDDSVVYPRPAGPRWTLRGAATRLWVLTWLTFLAYGGLSATANQARLPALAVPLARGYAAVAMATVLVAGALSILMAAGAAVDAVRGRFRALAALRWAAGSLAATAILIYALIRWLAPAFPLALPG